MSHPQRLLCLYPRLASGVGHSLEEPVHLTLSFREELSPSGGV